MSAAVENPTGQRSPGADILGGVAAILDRRPRSDNASSRLATAEARAAALAAEDASGEIRRAAAVEYLGSAVTTLAVEGSWPDGAARETVTAAAQLLEMSPGAALLAVFLRALGQSDPAQLPPQTTCELFLWLLVELGPAKAASLWMTGANGRVEVVAASGEAPQSRRFRRAATAALEKRPGGSPQVHAVTVDRWDRPAAALVARASSGEAARLEMWLREGAAALTPVLERETLFQRNASREQQIVAATERRFLRLSYDLHDGPLQEMAGLAEELRLLRSQLESVVDPLYAARIAGRFDDLDARLGSLDGKLRALSSSLRPTAVVGRQITDVLEHETARFRKTTGIATSLTAEGSLSDLTDSQKIVLYRFVQEALSNVRKHSRATQVEVEVRGTPTYLTALVADDGCGFDTGSVAKRALPCDRLGLAGLRERVQLLGGVVEIDTRPGQGVVVAATLPRWRPLERQRRAIYAATV